jgi:hypothetical protein
MSDSAASGLSSTTRTRTPGATTRGRWDHGLGFTRRQGGQPDDELGPTPGPRAMGVDVPPMELDQPLHDCETDAEAALGAVELGFSLGEEIEDVG